MVTHTEPSARLSRRTVRDLQRAAHIVTGTVLLGYIYAAPLLGGGFVTTVRWLVVPAAVLSGLALWKWRRLRTLVRGRKA